MSYYVEYRVCLQPSAPYHVCLQPSAPYHVCLQPSTTYHVCLQPSVPCTAKHFYSDRDIPPCHVVMIIVSVCSLLFYIQSSICSDRDIPPCHDFKLFRIISYWSSPASLFERSCCYNIFQLSPPPKNVHCLCLMQVTSSLVCLWVSLSLAIFIALFICPYYPYQYSIEPRFVIVSTFLALMYTICHKPTIEEPIATEEFWHGFINRRGNPDRCLKIYLCYL